MYIIKLFLLTIITCNFSYGLETALGPLSSLFNLEQIDQYNNFALNIEKDIDGIKKRKDQQQQKLLTYLESKKNAQNTLATLKEKSRRSSSTQFEFTQNLISLEMQKIEVIDEIIHVNQQIINLYNEYIKLLQDWKNDPEFKSKLSINIKSIYSLEDLLKITDLVLEYEFKLKNLEESLKKASSELDNRKKAFELAKQEYEDKRSETREFKSREVNSNSAKEKSKFSLAQQGELLDSQEQIYKYKKELSEFQIKEIELRERLIDEQIKIVNRQLEIIYKFFSQIKRELQIDDKDIIKSQEALQQQISLMTKNQEEYNKQLEALDEAIINDQNKIDNISRKFRINSQELDNFTNWILKPKTINQWNALLELGSTKNGIKYSIEISKEELTARLELEKAKLNDQKITTQIINSWKKITSPRNNQDEILKDINVFEKERAEINSQLSMLSDKRSAAVNNLNNCSRISDLIKEKLKELKNQKETIFKENEEEYNNLKKLLEQEVAATESRLDQITRLIELYTSVTAIKEQEIRKLDLIIQELKSKIAWRISPPLWRGLQTFIPDMKRFIKYIWDKDIFQSISLNKQTIEESVNYYSDNLYNFLYLLSCIAIIILIYFVASFWLPEINKVILGITPRYGIGQNFGNLIYMIIGYIHTHLLSIFIWFLFYILIRFNYIKDIYTGVIFYLISIPFWLMHAKNFLNSLPVNKTDNRFFKVFSLLTYCTVIILFFREAFLWAPLPKSTLPTMLLALNFIILQITLISVIGKETILNLIPRTTPLWQWVYDHVKKYYYLFLSIAIFIIIMSNPYVGYGAQFFYIVTRILLIALLIPFFISLHNQLKRISGSLFFYSDGDVIKERFPYGRTLYGLFVISSFIIFLLFAFIIAANIWGYHIGWRDIYDWLHKEIYLFKDPNTGLTVSVNSILLSKVLLYVLSGIIIAFIVNKLLLKRMFDLLLINIGVQNAVLSITRAIIILASIIIGLQSIGLSTSLLYIFAIIGGLGVAGKEFISDFIGYFVILIQRPIKIGDLIRIEGEVSGVVRHITLRSVVIRRKNSVTVIVPNSHVMTKPVINWNYSRTFFAFDDIMLTIPYSADPSLAKELILKVLHTNINILKNPAPIVWLNEFTENGFQFLVRGFLSADKVLDQFDIASDIRLELVKILRANNIEVASPTRILRVIQSKDSDSNPIEL